MDSACFASAIKIIVLLLSQLAVILLNPQTLTTVSDTLHRKRFQSVFNCKTTIPILAGYVLVQRPSESSGLHTRTLTSKTKNKNSNDVCLLSWTDTLINKVQDSASIHQGLVSFVSSLLLLF